MGERGAGRRVRGVSTVALLLLAACSGGSGAGPVRDASTARDSAVGLGCSGDCRDFVVDRLLLPTTTQGYALDLTGDGQPDNELRTSLTFLQTFATEPFQSALDRSVARGETLLVLRLRSADFVQASSVRAQAWLAADQLCCQSEDPVLCRSQAAQGCFDGSHSFAPADSSPQDMIYGGSIADGAFELGPSRLELELTVADTIRPVLILEQARLRGRLAAGAITDGIIAGSFNVDQLFQVAVDLGNASLREDPDGDTARTIRDTFELGPGQQLTLALVRGNELFQQLFFADLPNNRMSLGLGFSAVGAQIDMP